MYRNLGRNEFVLQSPTCYINIFSGSFGPNAQFCPFLPEGINLMKRGNPCGDPLTQGSLHVNINHNKRLTELHNDGNRYFIVITGFQAITFIISGEYPAHFLPSTL